MQILDHNLKAYKALIKSFKKANRACIVHPTGLGKSYIAYQLIATHRWVNFPRKSRVSFNYKSTLLYKRLEDGRRN